MVKADEFDAAQLSKAVLVWTGYGSAMWPHRNDAALASVFPVQIAAKLLPIVKGLEEDFFKSEAWKTATSLSKMGETAGCHCWLVQQCRCSCRGMTKMLGRIGEARRRTNR